MERCLSNYLSKTASKTTKTIFAMLQLTKYSKQTWREMQTINGTFSWLYLDNIIAPRHNKANKMSMCPVKTQLSLGICPAWSESSLTAWRKLGSLATVKTLIRLDGCPGWSESSLGAQSLCWFCHVPAHIIKHHLISTTAPMGLDNNFDFKQFLSMSCYRHCLYHCRHIQKLFQLFWH